MNIHLLKALLGWSTLINYIILCIWWLVFAQAQAWFYQLHLRAMRMDMTLETFQSMHYMLMGVFEIIIIIFNLVPFLVLLVISYRQKKKA